MLYYTKSSTSITGYLVKVWFTINLSENDRALLEKNPFWCGQYL